VIIALSAVSHWSTLRRLRRGETPALSVWPLSITIAILLAVVGLGALWDLMSR